jgi:hypothetical protein
MEFEEYPLLSYSDLMLVVLKTAARGQANLRDCLSLLRQLLEVAHERPPVPEAEILRRLEAAKTYLLKALLLVPAGAAEFVITARGRQALTEHPMGVDDTVLMQFPEFREFIRRAGEPAARDDPRIGEFDEGYAAYQEGQMPADNPYEFDRIEHLAWENGWFSAYDDDARAAHGAPRNHG